MAKILAQHKVSGRTRMMGALELKHSTTWEAAGSPAPKPAKEVQPVVEGVAPMPQVLAKIKASNTPEEVDAALAGDTRPQLISAAGKRKAELAKETPKEPKVVTTPEPNGEVAKAAAPKATKAPKPTKTAK